MLFEAYVGVGRWQLFPLVIVPLATYSPIGCVCFVMLTALKCVCILLPRPGVSAEGGRRRRGQAVIGRLEFDKLRG